MMVAALVSASFTSCIEEIDPQTSTVTEQQAKDAPGAFDNFVANLTGNLSGQFIYGGDSHYVFDFGYPAFFLVRDVMGQDIVPVGTNNWFDTWYQDFNYLSPNYARTQFPWTLYFGWIKDCNIVLNQAGAVDYAAPVEGREVGAGIAYTLRAMYYFDMARMYAAETYLSNKNALTVPKVTEATTIEEVQHNPRMTWEEAFDFMLADLDAAEKLLADYQRADVYTPDVSVVYGLKARVYLERQDWANAEKYAKMAQEGYRMMTQEEFLSRDYGFNSPNDSWMFGITFKATDPNIVENDGDSSWGSVMMLENGFDCGYAANYGGPNVIDRHLYETIPASDYRKMCWVDFELEDLIDPDAEDIPSDLLNALSAYSNYPERIYAAGVDNASYGLGGLSVKFRNAAGKANVKYDAWVVAVPLMRVEEMMLIEAEAAGMQSEAKGIELLTKFAKARDPYYTYGTHRDAYYNTSTSQFQNEVWWQRRVELWGEGFATFDIKRLNKGVIRSYPGTNHIEGSRFNVNTVPNWMVWCFVNTEAQYNESLVKNPDPVRPAGDSDEFAW